MSVQIVVPVLGESVLEATVSNWLKQEGSQVKVGEPLVELETDKVDLEVGAPQDGVLAKIEVPTGQDVKVGDVLGLIEPAVEVATAESERPSPEQTVAPHTVVGSGDQTDRPETTQLIATPVAQRMAQEYNIDLATVTGTGAGGRITREDVERLVRQDNQPPEPAPRQESGQEPAPAPAETSPPGTTKIAPILNGRREKHVRLSRRRRTIATRLVEAQHAAAMLTTFNDVDMSAVAAIRQRRREAFQQQYGVKLGLMSFFVKVAIGALKAFPRVNAELQGEDLVLKQYYDIGIAIGAEEGLVVPVLRDADRLSFAEIERGIGDFVEKSKTGKLSIEDLRGGTFTITNGGVFGSLLSTPILNPPQVAILGLHRIEDRPVAREGSVVIRPMMYLALSYDHRVVDGREAVQFLVKIKEYIEDPEALLLEL